MENNIWFTSDLHFGHNKDFMYVPRGFNSIEEHDEAIINNWNSMVKPEDTVYILGDLMLNDNEHGLECIKRLNGNLYIVYGNHDTNDRIDFYSDNNIGILLGYSIEIKIGKNYFYLSHYPTITANYDDGKPWAKHLINLHGHTHDKEKFYNSNPYMYNVALDAHNNFPVSIDEIIEDIKNKKMELDRNVEE